MKNHSNRIRCNLDFFKKVPYRFVHPEASRIFDGYYTLVPRNPCDEMTAEQLAVVDACEKRVLDLVRADLEERRKQENGPRKHHYVKLTVRETFRKYISRNNDERVLVGEKSEVSKIRLLKSDYRAFPLRVALSIHRAGGDGLALARQEAELSAILGDGE